ncbi:hypothetical protein M1271_07015 [Patescibacteria group bacterium]|nr:hypothetical protein [Patescibacteria group bacterium]MCL5798124.1 hypothetical protein [Patescibacteria group bacterium]
MSVQPQKNTSISIRFVIFFILMNLVVIFANVPIILRAAKTPHDRIFPYVHSDWPHDYYLYLAVINQGENGRFLYQDPYSTEKMSKGVFYTFFTGIGQVAGLFHLSPIAAYHLTIIIFTEIFLILVYFLSGKILSRKNAIWGAIFGLLGTISPTLMFAQPIYFPISMPWWIVLDALNRIYDLPHYIASEAFLLAAILLVFLFFRKPKLKYALLAAISIFIGGMILPSVLIPVAVGIPIAYFIYIARIYFEIKRVTRARYPVNLQPNLLGSEWHDPKRNMAKLKLIINLQLIKGFSVIIFAILACYAIIKYQVTTGFPWSTWVSWGVERWNWGEPDFNRNLLEVFGILPLLSIPAVYHAVKKNSWELLFISVWAATPFIMLPFVNPFGIAKIRLVEEAPYIPLGILSGYTIFKIIPPIKKRLIQYSLIVLFFATTLPSSFKLWKTRMDYIKNEPVYDHIYIPKTSVDAMKFIKENVPKNSVFLSNEKMGIIIPAFNPTISYFGHVTQTMDYQAKEQNVDNFFGGKWTSQEAYKFLRDNGINYIYYGWQEKDLGGDINKYSFLEKIFDNGPVKIYQIKLTNPLL